MSDPILELSGLTKVYSGGLKALDDVDLTIRKGEIFALLGPNGAGKTTLIGAVCGLVRPTSGTLRAFGQDLQSDWRQARARIGLVPQELSTDMFEPVKHAVEYSRGLFGLAPDPGRIEEILRSLSLWDKRNNRIMELSGGMKRRVLIAKAMAHEPDLLFLDEPTAGVDVELRKDMWHQIDAMRARGVTVILTTHYIEEAEEMADRVGIIRKGRILMVDEKDAMMARPHGGAYPAGRAAGCAAARDCAVSRGTGGRRPFDLLSRRRWHGQGPRGSGRSDQGPDRQRDRLCRNRRAREQSGRHFRLAAGR